MFDSIAAFTKQFIPTEGGYLYYPSKKGGGKLVSAEEFDQLIEGWRKVAGRRGGWVIVSIVILVIFVWNVASEALSLPEWSDSIIAAASVIGTSSWLLWASFAPRRLVRDRPTIAPPRPISEVKRQVRAALNWRVIILALFLSGVVFIGSINSLDRGLKSWAWLIGSGGFFALYISIGIRKFGDR